MAPLENRHILIAAQIFPKTFKSAEQTKRQIKCLAIQYRAVRLRIAVMRQCKRGNEMSVAKQLAPWHKWSRPLQEKQNNKNCQTNYTIQ